MLDNIKKAASIDADPKFLNISPNLGFNNTYLFFVVLIFSICIFFIHVTVFLDDVFIYLRVAKNIANGTGPILNPGDHHFPVTSPLWAFLLGFLHKVFGFIDLMELSKIIFTVFLGLASFLGFVCLRFYIGSWAILVPLPVFFNFITLSTVGGEIALVYLCIFGILWAYYIKKNFLFTGFWAAAAYLARGELVLLVVPILLHFLFQGIKEKKSFRSMTVDIGKMIAVFLVIISIWHIYYAVQFRAILPKTLNTKTIQGKSGLWPLYYHFGRTHTFEILGGRNWLVFFLLFGLFYFRALSISLLCFTVLHYYAYKYLTIAYYHWYFYDFYLLIPVFTVFGIIAFFIFLEKFLRAYNYGFRESPRFPKLIKATAVLLLFCTAVFFMLKTTRIRNVPDYNYKKDDRFQKYSKVVQWTKQMLKKGDVVLSPEIGIIGYFLEDSIIRDFNGIASPGVTVGNINNLDYFVGTYSPRFIFSPPGGPHKYLMEYFIVNGDVYIYKKGYEAKINDEGRESVFFLIDCMPVPADFDTLNQLKCNARCPGVELIREKGKFILCIPLSANFESTLKVPGNATGISWQFSFLTDFFKDNKKKCKVVLRVRGIREKQETFLYRKALKSISIKRGREISIGFPNRHHGFDSLAITLKVEQKKGFHEHDNDLSREGARLAICRLQFNKEHSPTICPAYRLPAPNDK
jgi:hypothetical protein